MGSPFRVRVDAARRGFTPSAHLGVRDTAKVSRGAATRGAAVMCQFPSSKQVGVFAGASRLSIRRVKASTAVDPKGRACFIQSLCQNGRW